MEKWKIKAKIVAAEKYIPFGSELYYFYQRHIRKSLIQSSQKLLLNYEWKVFDHIKYIQQFGRKDICNAKFFEFGAGWDLLAPIGISMIAHSNSDKIADDFEYICVDINEFMRPKEVYETIQCYGSVIDQINKLYENEENLPYTNMQIPLICINTGIKEFLRKEYGINYKAPCDAGNTHLSSESIDYIISNTTLQHIPIVDVDRIIKECYRILKIGGVFSCNVSYMDHYSNFDKNISVFNFLQYSDVEWSRYNPPFHYQNRMRHSDYKKIFRDNGFIILEEKPYPVLEEDLKILNTLHIDGKFRKYNIEDLAIRKSGFVLGKR